ncbi:hypothetical protein ANN_18793 [Periplaneta americana]|uniref:Uncharacterized protein n=1 Tax=Periplaneta americana TaxID=6978 RepID=A0ABQ8SQ85_PERAM|nr:hypothetical protein ANN_18793 [Periplaneta americana]
MSCTKVSVCVSVRVSVVSGMSDDDDEDEEGRRGNSLRCITVYLPPLAQAVVHNFRYHSRTIAVTSNTMDSTLIGGVLLGVQFKMCLGSLYAVMWLADEPREFNIPTLPQLRRPRRADVAHRRVLFRQYLRIASVSSIFNRRHGFTCFAVDTHVARSQLEMKEDKKNHGVKDIAASNPYDIASSCQGEQLHGTHMEQTNTRIPICIFVTKSFHADKCCLENDERDSKRTRMTKQDETRKTNTTNTASESGS